MRILGIDPGTLRTGWGVVERVGPRLRGVQAGVIRTTEKANLTEKLRVIYRELSQVIEEHKPCAIAVEDIFFGRYANAALKLGHVRGVALLCAAHAQIEVSEFPPAVVKCAIAGRGRADKVQVARLVGAILGWKELPSADATDALAVAITYANSTISLRSRVEPALPI